MKTFFYCVWLFWLYTQGCLADQIVNLAWEASTSSGIIDYRLYWSDTLQCDVSGGCYYVLANQIDCGNNLTGQVVFRGNTMRIIAVAWDGVQESGPSNVLEITAGTLNPPPLALTSAASLKIHGSASYRINLPLTGVSGIECRNGNDYTIVFTFSNTLNSIGATLSTCGITSGVIDSSDAHKYNVTLTGVGGCNAQYITITLTNVNDTLGNNVGSVSVTMGLLIGDVNGSRRVDSGDVSLVGQQTLQTVTSSNFREDINFSGRIDSGDVSIARQLTLTSLP